MIKALARKNILLGITGGIAAYKSCEIVRRLKDAGANVRVVMTQAAKAFVTPLTFQALSGYPVADSLLDEDIENGMGHIELARWADAILIAPLSANTLAKLAGGLADDLLSAICLATDAPIALAPAMNQQMWQNPATQRNLQLLCAQGFHHLGVGSGEQACGEVGPGRLLDPHIILDKLTDLFFNKALSGKHVVITAGPTREYLDPVRFLSNPSSGKMGYALAQAAIEAGAQVTLISGPVVLAPISNAEMISVISALEMHQAVMAHIHSCDIFIATAAVADYRAETISAQKVKKSKAAKTVSLIANPDILAEVCRLESRPFCVGFAAETEHHLENAKRKLQQKGCDLICLNDVSDDAIGFGANDNEMTLISSASVTALGRLSKSKLANIIIEKISEMEAVCQ